ncbi:MAG: CRISPR-associated endoribonuclease Cas6 [Bacillota bacterium]
MTAIDNGVLPYNNSLLIHGLFLSLINEADPLLSKEIHDQDGFKPYTLSMLRGGKNINGEIIIYKGSNYKCRITFMSDNLFNNFYNIVFYKQKQGHSLKIGKINFFVAKVKLEKNEDYYDLVENNNSYSNMFELTFFSSTSFRVKGKNYIFPDPVNIVRSYFNKWNAFCPKYLKYKMEDLDVLVNSFFPVKHRIFTELFDMGNYKIVGFKGRCQYEIERGLEFESINILMSLIKYSRYCGTGYKTTMGMGQTGIRFL